MFDAEIEFTTTKVIANSKATENAMTDTNVVPAASALPAALHDGAVALVEDSISENTRRAYSGALRRFDAWLLANGLESGDQPLALYLAALDAEGKALSSASMVCSAVKLREPAHMGRLAQQALRGYRRGGRSERGRGQAASVTTGDVSDMMDAAKNAVDRALIGVLFQCGLRRSEAAALQWRDIEDGTTDADLIRVRVRKSKTNQEGAEDIRICAKRVASALRELRDATGGNPNAPVFVGRQGGLCAASINLRVKALAKAAGIGGKVSAHSARIGLASELTLRGASVQEVMAAGNWRSASMVRHYSAGVEAERGAVAKYLR